MSTLMDLVTRGDLTSFEDDTDRSPPWRRIYATPAAARRMEHDLPRMTTMLSGGKTSPAQQVDALLARFSNGGRLCHYSDFHVLTPKGNGIWELKTVDVRLFGWFPARDAFVITNVLDAYETKATGLYNGAVQEAVAIRERMDLDPPKFVPGEDPDDVVSNWNSAPR